MLDRNGDGAVIDDYRLHVGLTKIHRTQTLVPRSSIAAELLAGGLVKTEQRDDLEAPVRMLARGNFGGSSVAGQVVHFSTVDAIDGWQVGLLDFAKLSDLPKPVLDFLEAHVNDAARAQLIAQARGEQPPAPPVVDEPAPVSEVPNPAGGGSTPAAEGEVRAPVQQGEGAAPSVAGPGEPVVRGEGVSSTPLNPATAAAGPATPAGPAPEPTPPSSSSTPATDVVQTPTASPEPAATPAAATTEVQS